MVHPAGGYHSKRCCGWEETQPAHSSPVEPFVTCCAACPRLRLFLPWESDTSGVRCKVCTALHSHSACDGLADRPPISLSANALAAAPSWRRPALASSLAAALAKELVGCLLEFGGSPLRSFLSPYFELLG